MTSNSLLPILVSRRRALEILAQVGVASAIPAPVFSQTAESVRNRTSVLRYLESLVCPDGGYGWEDQPRGHLTPTFAVIGCYHLLGEPLPDAKRVADFVRSHHPSRLKKLEQEHRVFLFQQVQALTWLGQDASEFREQILAWKQPLAYMKAYEQHGYPVFQSEVSVFLCRALLGLPLAGLAPAWTEYLDSRRRANGSFSNTPAADEGDGHVMNTWWGLEALRVLGRLQERKDETIAWLRACQLENGGFAWQPKPEFAGVDDVAYTRAAVRALRSLRVSPTRRDSCIAYLLSLANADGGFSDRPGWLSNPLATYYALDALDALGALESLDTVRRRVARARPALPSNLQVFSIQLEALGQGSPAEAVDLAQSLRIHLWGAKNAEPEWIARAQLVADQKKVPVRFFVSNEEYGTWVNVPGLGTYSHTSDVIARADVDLGASLAKAGVVSWREFRERRLTPLTKAGGRLIWQFGENEELVRLFLDDSLERGGYAAISTFHFGNPDFTNTEPFLQRWRGRIPFVALQDAHGIEPWWLADLVAGFRTVFLATEPTWEGWLSALQQNWVAAIRHDAVSANETWIHAGSREVLEFVRERERTWRWWDNPEITRPLVSIVPVTPADEFEVARPSQGVALRVRCAWETTPQGLLKQPIAELVRLTLDGLELSPRLATVPAQRGALLADRYHQVNLPDLKPGRHVASATVRVIETQREISRTTEFIVA